MHGPARLPTWLHPITPATIGILALPLVLIAQLVDALIRQRREDKRDEE